MSDETLPRPGTAADLVQRMDRLERNHDVLAREVSELTSTVKTVAINQGHAEELNKLRFSSLDTATSNIAADLKGFMARIDALISGETETQQSRAGREMVKDYQLWRDEVDTFMTQGRFAGRLAQIAVGGNLLAIAAAIYAIAAK